MTDLFVLDVQTDQEKNRAVLRLSNKEGVHIGLRKGFFNWQNPFLNPNPCR